MPEHTQLSALAFGLSIALFKLRQRVVDADELMVLRQYFVDFAVE